MALCVHSSMKLLDNVKLIKITFLKTEIYFFFDIVMLHQDFKFQSKKVLKFFRYTIC